MTARRGPTISSWSAAATPAPASSPCPIVRVANVKEAAAHAVQLGGRIAVAPSDAEGQGWRAVVVDPAGVHLGLLELPADAAAAKAP